jgi:hypothetical protein
LYNFLISIAVTFILCGCAQKTIYVSSPYNTTKQVKDLQDNLESQGYNVKLINISLPEFNNKTIILHSPAENDFGYIKNVKSILKAEGFGKIDVMGFNSFNHFYHKSNIGIYLPNKSNMILPTVMQTYKCQKRYGTLELKPNMTFTIEIDKNETQKKDINISGLYELNQNGDGYFSTSKGKIYFTVKNTTSKTYLGVRPASILTVKNQEIDVLPKQCSFITIYEHQ